MTANPPEQSDPLSNTQLAEMLVRIPVDYDTLILAATRLRAATERGEVRDVLEACRDRFAEYVESHKAKRTPDGYVKAARNAEMLGMVEGCLARLTTLPQSRAAQGGE